MRHPRVSAIVGGVAIHRRMVPGKLLTLALIVVLASAEGALAGYGGTHCPHHDGLPAAGMPVTAHHGHGPPASDREAPAGPCSCLGVCQPATTPDAPPQPGAELHVAHRVRAVRPAAPMLAPPQSGGAECVHCLPHPPPHHG